MITNYRIVCRTSHAYLGSYEGETREDAIDAYIRDAGYTSVDAAAEVVGQSRETFLRELDVTEEP